MPYSFQYEAQGGGGPLLLRAIEVPMCSVRLGSLAAVTVLYWLVATTPSSLVFTISFSDSDQHPLFV